MKEKVEESILLRKPVIRFEYNVYIVRSDNRVLNR